MANYVRRFLAWDGCLLVSSLIGIAIGFAIGFACNFAGISSQGLVWLGLPGELYMRMLKAAILPLIISTIVTGTASLKPEENGKLSAVALGYIVITNVIGAVVGTLLAIIIRPGYVDGPVADSTDVDTLDTGHLQTQDLFADLIRNLVPDNVVSACFEKTQTRYKPTTVPLNNNDDNDNATAASNVTSTEHYKRYLDVASGSNILGLVVVCTAVGMAAAKTGEKAASFLNFFRAASDVILTLVQALVLFTPVGAASLVAKAIAGSKDIAFIFRSLGLFVLAESVGNLFFIFLLYPLAYFAFVRRNPLNFLRAALRPVVAGTAANSSALAMPEILKVSEGRLGMDERASSLVAPLVVSINRDGSAMFISLTSIYMTQVQGDVTLDAFVIITVLAAVGSLAIPAVASSSVVTVLMILASLNVTPANIGIILALEWFSDRFRTMTNCFSHVLCCAITWSMCKNSLQKSTERRGLEGHHDGGSTARKDNSSGVLLDNCCDESKDNEAEINL